MTDTVTCDCCGSSVEGLFCAQCGKDHRKRFPECELISYLRRAYGKAVKHQAGICGTDAAEKIKDRAANRIILTRHRLWAMAGLLQTAGRAQPFPELADDPPAGDAPSIPDSDQNDNPTE